MNYLKNKVQLIGNLGMDPEIKELDNGKKLARFSLATSENYKNAEGKKITDTQWHQIVAWGAVANVAERFLKKGREVAVEGRLTHRSYDDKDGVKRYITEVVVNEIMMLDKAQIDGFEKIKTPESATAAATAKTKQAMEAAAKEKAS